MRQTSYFTSVLLSFLIGKAGVLVGPTAGCGGFNEAMHGSPELSAGPGDLLRWGHRPQTAVCGP
jgi:hypothetical protein